MSVGLFHGQAGNFARDGGLQMQTGHGVGGLRGPGRRVRARLASAALASVASSLALLAACGGGEPALPGGPSSEGKGGTLGTGPVVGEGGVAGTAAGNGGGTGAAAVGSSTPSGSTGGGAAGGDAASPAAGTGGVPGAGELPLPPGTVAGGAAGSSPSIGGVGGRRGGAAGSIGSVMPPLRGGVGGRGEPAQGGRRGPSGGAPGFGGDGGSGGYGGYGGAAGAMGSTPDLTCTYPAVTDDLTPWQQDDTQRTLEEDLTRVATGMAGAWHGHVTTPWVPVYEVTMSFTADGHYGARCAWSSNACCVAMYYGTDDDTPLKRYAFDSVTTIGKVSGSIDIIFGGDYGGQQVPYYESGYQGTLKNVELDATGNRLRFDFIYGDGYGPLKYDLERVATP